MKIARICLFSLLCLSLPSPTLAQATSVDCPSWGQVGKLLYSDNFSTNLDQWASEFAPADSSIALKQQQLLIDVAGGATVWFRHKLAGNYRLSYRRKVVMAHGRNDRLSDLNQFWMATDPQHASVFGRDGSFAAYDNLRLYYAGIGGNTNSTTRMRKYNGAGERSLLRDLNDKKYLLEANREYRIQIEVYQGCTRLLVDDLEFFSYRDPQPLREGYFAFRTTQSRQAISDFKVVQLD